MSRLAPGPPGSPGCELLRRIWARLGPALDGGQIVERALGRGETFADDPAGLHVLALGKAAGAMLAGLARARGASWASALAITAPTSAPVTLPAGVRLLVGEHPLPGPGSEAAARTVVDHLRGLGEGDRLLVLLSGGASALAALPAAGLSLADKRLATGAVASAGAAIAELNTVRKHLSAVKGGRLALLTRGPVRVLALSDVPGDDPGVIGSGPFSPDPSRFAEALAILDDRAPGAAPAARALLARGAAGELPETPKPGDARLAHVSFEVLAGPDQASAEARRLIEAEGLLAGLLSRHVEGPVAPLAQAYAERAREEQAAGGRPRVFVGNGEPRIVLPSASAASAGAPVRGGRCTHLALLFARTIAGLTGVAFLAAGTDDRDGSSGAAGAVVDGTTWPRAVAAGLEPERALLEFDSARPLEALGCLVAPHGTSNLLDLHLLALA